MLNIIYIYIYIYIHIPVISSCENCNWRLALDGELRHQRLLIHPVPITIFSLTRLFPRVGLPRNLLLICGLTAALRFSKGWVQKDLNLVMGIGCKGI